MHVPRVQERRKLFLRVRRAYVVADCASAASLVSGGLSGAVAVAVKLVEDMELASTALDGGTFDCRDNDCSAHAVTSYVCNIGRLQLLR